MTIFTYGSLMFPEVWEKVTGLTVAGVPAVLADHAARRIRGQSYPVLQAEAGARVRGVLYVGVPPDAVARLDEFEGAFYDRVPVAVRLEQGGATASAWVYRAARPEDPDILPEAWVAEHFARESLARFLQEELPAETHREEPKPAA